MKIKYTFQNIYNTTLACSLQDRILKSKISIMEQKSNSHFLPPKDANALSARQQHTELAYLLDKFPNKVSES